MKTARSRYLVTFLVVLFSVFTFSCFAQAADAGKVVNLWGLALSFEMMLSWCLVPLAWAITEYAPVPDKSQPMIPLVFGFVASMVGYQYFGVDAGTAQLQFAAALAAGNMNGWVKKTIPWVVGRYKAMRAKANTPQP